jgi:hypothetical protein
MKSMNVTETRDQQRNMIHNPAANSCWFRNLSQRIIKTVDTNTISMSI